MADLVDPRRQTSGGWAIRLKRRTLLQFFAAAGSTAALGGLLAACGGDDEDEPEPTTAGGSTSGGTTPQTSGGLPTQASDPRASGGASPTASGGAATPSGAAAQPQGEQKLTIGLSLDPGGTVDPRIVWNIPNISAAMNHLYDPLVMRSESMEVVPVLAESWEWTDNLNLVFKLRKNVKFHNGEAFNAESVKWTLDTIYNPDTKSPIRPLLPVDGKMEVVDESTVRYVVTKPFRPLVTLLPWVLMMPAKAGAEGANFASTAIGTGAFKLKEYRASERLVQERNADYWGQKPILEEYTIRFIPENGTRVASLETGEVMMINNVPPDQISRIKDNQNLDILSSDTLRMVYLAMQCDRPPFSDVRVRQAVAYALDREAMVESILQGYGSVAKAPLSPFARTYRSDLPPYTYDPNKAKDLLQQAGVAQGTTIKFGSSAGRYLMDKQIAEACQQWLADIGFDVEFEASEFGVYWPKAQAGEYDIYLGSRTGSTTANDPLVLNDFYTPTSQSTVKYSNPRVDELVEQGLAAATATEAEVNAIYGEIQEIVWREVPWTFMYYQPELVAINKKLKGFKARPDEMYYFHTAYLG